MIDNFFALPLIQFFILLCYLYDSVPTKETRKQLWCIVCSLIIISATYWVFNLFMKENKEKINKRWWFVFFHRKIIGERTEEVVKIKKGVDSFVTEGGTHRKNPI